MAAKQETHTVHSHTKRENDCFNNNDIQFVVSRFISHDDLVCLSANEQNSTKDMDQIIIHIQIS